MNVLELPYAYGEPPVHGRVKVAPEDFVVREWLGFEPDNEGDHWLLKVRKRGANTQWVARQIAKHARIHPRDVGFAGLKDRHAITEQSFSVPVRTAVSDWMGVAGEGYEVIQADRHRRKLKRGALRGNDFEIVVRDAEFDLARLRERASLIEARGVPNYFGPQRFGRDGGNLKRARLWFSGELELTERWERGFALSAARSSLFNDVLARRVIDSTWDRLLDGDVANLEGTNSIFAVDQVTPELNERCEQLDVHPTGPLWGKGTLGTAGLVATLEQETIQKDGLLAAGLERAGLEQERRALRLKVSQFELNAESDNVRLKFRLGRGAFATSVLHELIAGMFGQGIEEGEDD
ncbi:MAG: tRNA pseudouridine(13) synthase TruD [Povalibacter sp.]